MIPKTRNPRRHSVIRPLRKVFLWQLLRTLSEWFFAAILIVAIAFSGWLAYKRVTEHAFFPLKRILFVRPLIYGDPGTITTLVSKYGSHDMLRIDVQSLAERISTIGWVASVSLRKRWPDALQIDVHERIPILRWGKEDFLDYQGTHFSLPSSPVLDTLFPATGPKGHEKSVLNMYRTIVPWLKREKINIKELILDSRLVWHVHLENGINVIVGREDLERRFKKLVVVTRRIIKRYRQYIDSVDLRYQDGFSVRWKDGVAPIGSEKEKAL